jgi:hypothetical protein
MGSTKKAVFVNGLAFEKLDNNMWQVIGTTAKVYPHQLFGDKNVEESDLDAWELELMDFNNITKHND